MFELAIKNRRMIQVTDQDGNIRLLEPYALFGEGLLHAYQVDGYSVSGEPVGWKNIKLKKLNSIILMSKYFKPRAAFNPSRLKDLTYAAPHS